VPTADIHVKADDTDATPWDNGAYADSTTYVSGQAAERAARDAAADIRELSARWLDGDPAEFELADGDVASPGGDRLSISEVASRAFERVDGPRARITGHGECNPNISPRPFVAHAAEAVVDTERGTFDLEKYAVAADCGFAINPENAKGQLYGGAAIGLGQALTEELVFDDDGTPAVGGLRDYQTLRSTDMPEEMEAILVETYEPTGPFGAKSIGEVGNTGPPGAVANAVADAVGVRIRDLPITDEKLRDALDPAE
jgi:CO/xanthine dehydrogenase Mo-binding subunit